MTIWRLCIEWRWRRRRDGVAWGRCIGPGCPYLCVGPLQVAWLLGDCWALRDAPDDDGWRWWW